MGAGGLMMQLRERVLMALIERSPRDADESIGSHTTVSMKLTTRVNRTSRACAQRRTVPSRLVCSDRASLANPDQRRHDSAAAAAPLRELPSCIGYVPMK